MAYDAATGKVILFGGQYSHHVLLGDTWVWNGSTWTQKHRATHPGAKRGAAMAYDAATGNVVLFGGDIGHAELNGTWVWDGSTWTRQHPATHPPGRWEVSNSMVYDAATGNVVLFGGDGMKAILGDTWVWNGSTWIQQHPATSPPARWGASMAYDVATGNVVLFGGWGTAPGALGDTWVWNGSTWIQQHPATSPPARYSASIAYDAATGNVVLFAGNSGGGWLGDTWTWAPASQR